MNLSHPRILFSVIAPFASLGRAAPVHAQDGQGAGKDSYKYYGPNGLYKEFNKDTDRGRALRLGRDTWIHWTWGNQKTLRKASVLAGNLPVPVSIDVLRLIDSRKRETRFRDLGLINEPNCFKNDKPDRFGFFLDEVKPDPDSHYPADYDLETGTVKQGYTDSNALRYPGTNEPISLAHYGRPTGIVGVRLFKNPKFDLEREDKWLKNKKDSLKAYFDNPGKVEPPYLVGFTCAFCHIAFNPSNPPAHPESPRWENLAANIGNQYLREGELFFGKGRIVFGNKNPIKGKEDDPYQTEGLTEGDFLYHYAVTQQPGTSETSRISYDFINNPNTINPLYGLKYRPTFAEHTPWGKKLSAKNERTWHALKDGADSVGIDWALMRVPLNIGCEGDYWLDRLFNPASGRKQRPVRLSDLLAGLDEKELKRVEESTGLKFDRSEEGKRRQAALRQQYRSEYGKEEFGQDWQEAWRRLDPLKEYLLSYEPTRLKDATPGTPRDDAEVRKAAEKDPARLRGAIVFGRECCHNSKQPFKPEDVQYMAFLDQNFLSNEERYPVNYPGLGTNMARSLATNGLDADVWAEFSSPDYKGLRPVGRVPLTVPVFGEDFPQLLRKPFRIEFEPPGGGRGYYRTPSLINLWATAPYLHNNSVGDYYVVRDDRSKGYFPNNGTRIGRKDEKTGEWVDYRIDVSVEGRLKMFEDGMRKLLNPAQRRKWVKRTSSNSSLVSNLDDSIHKLIVHLAGEVLKQEVRLFAEANRDLPPPPKELLEAAKTAYEEVVRQLLKDLKTKKGTELDPRLREVKDDLAAFQAPTGKLTGKLTDYLFDKTLEKLAANKDFPKDFLTDPNLKEAGQALKQKLQDKVSKLNERVKEALTLTVPKGFPINLYANLNAAAFPHAVLSHARYRDDPRALAEALLELSDCPELVEDAGHTYGEQLTDQEKEDLIAYLKLF